MVFFCVCQKVLLCHYSAQFSIQNSDYGKQQILKVFFSEQVNCPNVVCGLGGISFDTEKPWMSTSYQWWRSLLSLFCTHGFLHLVMIVLGEWMLLRQVERSTGSWRAAIIYTVSGVCGGMVSESVSESGGGLRADREQQSSTPTLTKSNHVCC